MAQSAPISSPALCTVLDPRGQPTATKKPYTWAPRLDTLQGKTIYIVDVGFGGGHELLEEMVAWFSRNMPSVKADLRWKKGNMMLDDPELWAEIKDQGHAVIFGVGG